MSENNTNTLTVTAGQATGGNSVCPSCGHCPTCGRGGHQVAPWIIPMQPQTPMYPTWPMYPILISGQSTTIC